jgi:tRNA dimethylallyltransferase
MPAGPASATAPVLLSGPTASGKSAVALGLARLLGGEILSADSMQVYRGMEVGTAKPSAAERALVPHHLIDLADVAEPFDTARWLASARTCLHEVQSRGRRPILCGGSGLYFRAWLHGLENLPAPDPALRAQLEERDLDDLLQELAQRDPATWARIDRANPRRVIRALEIVRLSDRPRPNPPPAAGSARATAVIVLRRTPADLRQRIELRVDHMFARDLVGETHRLLEAGLARNRTALQAIGYRQVVEHLRGERDLAATIALVKARTWQYARRQMTWFRHQVPVTWLDVEPGEEPEATAARIAVLAGAPVTKD